MEEMDKESLTLAEIVKKVIDFDSAVSLKEELVQIGFLVVQDDHLCLNLNL